MNTTVEQRLDNYTLRGTPISCAELDDLWWGIFRAKRLTRINSLEWHVLTATWEAIQSLKRVLDEESK